MSGWYWIGLSAGLGAAAGVLVSGFAARTAAVAIAVATAAGLGLGVAIDAWQPGSWGDVVAGAAVLVAGLAWIPVVGYLEAVALPAVAARLRRRSPERYAGLRTLAK